MKNCTKFYSHTRPFLFSANLCVCVFQNLVNLDECEDYCAVLISIVFFVVVSVGLGVLSVVLYVFAVCRVRRNKERNSDDNTIFFRQTFVCIRSNMSFIEGINYATEE